MMQAVSGMMQKIQAFFYRLLSSKRPDDGDDLSSLTDLAWLDDTERLRQDALLFWSESSLNRTTSLSAWSEPSRFYEKHTTALPQQGRSALDALAGTPAGSAKPLLFEQPANAAPAPVAGSPAASPAGRYGTGTGTLEPVRSFIDPLEDLYEPAGAGFAPARERATQPSGDLYAVIMRLSENRKY